MDPQPLMLRRLRAAALRLGAILLLACAVLAWHGAARAGTTMTVTNAGFETHSGTSCTISGGCGAGSAWGSSNGGYAGMCNSSTSPCSVTPYAGSSMGFLQGWAFTAFIKGYGNLSQTLPAYPSAGYAVVTWKERIVGSCGTSVTAGLFSCNGSDYTVSLSGTTKTFTASGVGWTTRSMTVTGVNPPSATTLTFTANFNFGLFAFGTYTMVIDDVTVTHYTGQPPDHFGVTVSNASPSTCAATTVTVTAYNAANNVLTGYNGTVNLVSPSTHGDWSLGSSPTPTGTFVAGAADSGMASYTFAAGDNGVAKFQFTNTHAESTTLSASDGSATGSVPVTFSNTGSYTITKDAADLVAGSNITVAGRGTVFKVTKGSSCGTTDTSYTGLKSINILRTDVTAGAAPTATLLTTGGAAQTITLGTTNTLAGLNFASGVASFTLTPANTGQFTVTVQDAVATSTSGTSGTITARPFAIVVSAIANGATNNPAGSAATDAVFAKAGQSFSASVKAYKWASGADSNNNGLPDAAATLAATTAGGVATNFGSTVGLGTQAGTQTPAGGTLGTLSGASATLAGGAATLSMSYSEVGSFVLNTSGVTSNFLGSGINLDATVFDGSGAQMATPRIGRFTPANFAISSTSITHRSGQGCAPASTFTYQGENFSLGYVLTAVNAAGATTTNYTGAYAKLALTTASALGLSGTGNLSYLSTGGSPRLSLGTATGSWANGVSSGATLTAAVIRATAPEAPDTVAFTLAPLDSDGVTTSGLAVGNADIRFGRLRLANIIGPQDRDLPMPVAAQYYNGTAFATNALDSCTRIAAANLSFGNFRKTLASADANLRSTPVSLSAGTGTLWLSKPGSGHAGTMDVVLSLGSTATPTHCLQSFTAGTGKAATAGANLSFLQGAWCGAGYSKDPAARASFGLFRGADNIIHMQEN